MKPIQFLCVLYITLLSAVIGYGDDISPSTKTEPMAVLLLYNNISNPNEIEWTDSEGSDKGKSHSIDMAGIGLRYFPVKWLYIDIVGKTSTTEPTVGSASSRQWNSSLGTMDSYGLLANYVYCYSDKINFHVGIGQFIHKCLFYPYGLNFYGGLNTYLQFTNSVVRAGVQYNITPRIAFDLFLVYEQPVILTDITTGFTFKYNYEPSLYFEPTMVFNF